MMTVVTTTRLRPGGEDAVGHGSTEPVRVGARPAGLGLGTTAHPTEEPHTGRRRHLAQEGRLGGLAP